MFSETNTLCLGIFPEPEHDPVIQIANMVINQGNADPFIRNVFTLNTCAPIVGCQVISSDNEADMLEVILFQNLYFFLCKTCTHILNHL